MHGLGWISSGRKTTAPGWLAWAIMRCKYVGEWYSRRGHFVPVNELMSIFEQIWETRKRIHDLKKYPQCRLHEKKSNLQFRSPAWRPAWRYGCVRPWIRNQVPENPTKVWVSRHLSSVKRWFLCHLLYQYQLPPTHARGGAVWIST